MKLITTLSFLVCFSCHAQSPDSLGTVTQDSTIRWPNEVSANIVPMIFYTAGSPNSDFVGRTYIQYRRHISNHRALKVDISQREIRHISSFGDVHYSDIQELQYHDTLRSTRYHSGNSTSINLRLGIEKSDASGIFTAGGNLILGHHRNYRSYFEDVEYYESKSSSWENYCTGSTGIQCPKANSMANYFSVGMSANANLNLKISERWGMSLVYEAQTLFHIQRNVTTEYLNPIGTGYFDNYPLNSFSEIRHNLDLLLRIRF